MSDIAEYNRLAEERRNEAARLDRRHAQLSVLRVATVAVVIGLLFWGRPPMSVDIVAGLLLFVAAVVAHSRVSRARARASAALSFYQRGLARIRHEWVGQGRSGERYRDADHPYAGDLGIFGRGSLFELLATTRTHTGEDTLARWLLTPASTDEATARQVSVRELAQRLDLREHIATVGDDIRNAVDTPRLRPWATAPAQLSGTATRLGLALLATCTCSVLAYWVATGALSSLALGLTFAQSLIAWTLLGRVRRVLESIHEPARDLETLASLLDVLDRESFTSPHLVALKSRLAGQRRASADIRRLSTMVAMAESRLNVMFALPAALMLWGTQWAFAIEAWRARTGAHIPVWLDTVGELEALLSIGGFAAEHPSSVYPEIVDAPPQIEALALAHPTLGSEAVGNDIRIARGGLQLVVVSGSNMSGKSTWMRTIGTTMVLAGLGAPVRAATCRLSMVAIGAAMRVEDSLTDGKSRFFAEITRLKQIVDLTTATRGGVLFLLDEILAGTNSHDRRVGAEAVVRGLVDAGAIGLVTTHDLALGEIVGRLEGKAINAHFEDQFVDGTLHFDYLLKSGIVRTSNALALMRSIGLTAGNDKDLHTMKS